jgi:hypothetical protein
MKYSLSRLKFCQQPLLACVTADAIEMERSPARTTDLQLPWYLEPPAFPADFARDADRYNGNLV